ncbi:hypothetical protein MMC30_007347 [Trapelia coarctata]|nr:hypothetical protein [Trapelia coarctata]
MGTGFLWNRHTLGYLTAPLPGAEILQKILVENLTNCNSFRIEREHEWDGLYESNRITTSDAVGIVLMIVAQTGLPIRSFHLDWIRLGTNWLDARRLPTSQFQTVNFRTGWSHLQELILGIAATPETVDLITELVVQAPNLKRLDTGSNFNHSSGSVLERLYSANTLPRLHELRLRSGPITEDFLLQFLLRFRDSLRAISLWHITITSGSWTSIFREWKANLPLLERIAVVFLVERHAAGPKKRVFFPSLAGNAVVPETGGHRFDLIEHMNRNEDVINGVRYEGPRMDVALDILEKSAVRW